MARSILAAVQQIKANVAQWLTADAIHGVCLAIDYTWRDRLLDPVTTVHLFILQMLHGNTACSHVPRWGGISCSGEAYCQARGRLPLALFRCLQELLGGRLTEPPDEGRWHGHRTFLADGSNLSRSDTPELQAAYGQPGAQKPGCGFPVMHVLALFHAASGFLIRVASAPLRTHDMSQVGRLHPDLAEGDVLVGDRAFCSFAQLALLAARKVLGVFRVHQKQIVNFRPHRRTASSQSRKRGVKGLPSSRWLKRLGRHDQLVEYTKPKQRPDWMTESDYADLPETICVRELRYTITIPGRRTRVVTLATTLLDPEKYPAAEGAELYGQRWQIETNFRHLKQTLGMEVLHGKTVEGVQKELTMYALVYNLVRLVMLEAAQRQQVPVARIRFVDALRWLADAANGITPLEVRVNPDRPNRYEPRVIKRRGKPYRLMNKPREILRKRLRTKEEAA